MLTYKTFVRYSTIIVLTFIISCTKEKEINVVPYKLPTQTEAGTIIYNPSTIVVNDQLNKNLVLITTNTLQYKTGSEIDNAKIGQVLMSDISSEAPNGYLRKVVSIKQENGKTTIETVNATLEEAIKECHLKLRRRLTAADVAGTDTTKRPKGGRLAADFSLSFPKFARSFSKEDNSTQGKILKKLDVEIEFSSNPDVETELDIENSKQKNFKFIVHFENSAGLKFKFGSGAKLSDFVDIAKGFSLVDVPLVPISLGGIPLASQKISLIVGLDGEVSGDVTLPIVWNFNVSAGVSYNDATGFQNVNSFTNNGVDMSGFKIEAKMVVEPWAQLQYRVSPFGDFFNPLGQSSIVIAARGSVKLEALLNQYVIEAGLKLGVKLYAKAKMQFLGKNIAEYESNFFDKYYDTPYRWQFVLPLLNLFSYTTDKILANMAVLQYSMKFLGTAIKVKQYGYCWSKTNTKPTLNGINVQVTYSGEPFLPPLPNGDLQPAEYNSSQGDLLNNDSWLTKLVPNTTYYACAYAKITDDIVLYGNIVSFTTCNLSIPTGRFNKIISLDGNTLIFNVDVSTGCQVAVWYKVYELKNNKWEVFITGTGQLQDYSNPNNKPTPFNKDIFVGGLVVSGSERYVKGKKYALKVIFANEAGSTETDYIPFER
jgi:hypothetical protein